MMDAFQKQSLDPTREPHARSMLIVEDDERLMQRLAQAMEARGFQVMIAGSVFEGLAQIQLSTPKYAVVDLRFEDGCGLDVVAALMQQRPNARAIILTGYGDIATAVKAAKLGAVDYLLPRGPSLMGFTSRATPLGGSLVLANIAARQAVGLVSRPVSNGDLVGRRRAEAVHGMLGWSQASQARSHRPCWWGMAHDCVYRRALRRHD